MRTPQRRLHRRLAATTGVAALALVAACGSTNTDKQAGSSTPTSAAPSEAVDSSLAALLPASVKQAGVVKVGSDVSYAPVEYFAADNKTVIGLDPDLAAALGAKLGVKLVFTNATFDGLIPAVTSKRFDIIMSAMSDTKERQGKLDFIDYFTVGTSILVQKGNPKKINGLDDLCGTTIALERGTTQDDVSTAQAKKCTDEGKGKLTVLKFDTDTDALTQVQTGRAVADMNDYPVAEYNARTKNGGNTFEVVGPQIEAGPYGIGIGKSDTGLRNALQGALKAIVADGTYNKILAKYGLQKGALTTAAINGGS